jgi:hypothetical protein
MKNVEWVGCGGCGLFGSEIDHSRPGRGASIR